MKKPNRSPVLTAEMLIYGYTVGIFPMADERTDDIHWYSPDPRAIIPIEIYQPWRSLRQALKKNLFEIKFDTAFESVMRACAAPRDYDSHTWISPEIIIAYTDLHRDGFAHSVEAWQENQLVGGLYGVSIGGAFFGESMFHTQPDASKIAMHALLMHLRAQGYLLLDTQFINDNVRRYGATEIPREEYLRRLESATAHPVRFHPLPLAPSE